MAELDKVFKALDVDNDGEVSKAELLVGYRKIFGDKAEEYVEAIFTKVDLDGSGSIDYNEWVVATINKKNLLTDEKLDQAFKMFDKDGGGSISARQMSSKSSFVRMTKR